MYCVYQHIRLDNNVVFYIGIGNKERPYSIKSRNKHWVSTVNKHGYRVEIIKTELSWDEACSWEKYLIELHGRRNKNNGTLVNMTDGGEGSLGCSPSVETRKKLSEFNKGKKYSEERKKRFMSSIKPITDETRRKMSEARKGDRHFNAKKVVNTVTGDLYTTAKGAADGIGMNYSTLLNMLRGLVKNKTSLEYYIKDRIAA